MFPLMPVTVTIRDETAGGRILTELPVTLDNELTTVKDIIIARVMTEVLTYNEKKPEYFQGLVQPTDAEVTLNGYRLHNRSKPVDADQQCHIALDAFRNNGYFVLIDDIQPESLDQIILLNKQSNISFVKLTPLVGG
ncbi:hypothetical protein [Paraflavitalea speifideaquila]|uniref:hypothetical protein n=1 Tax=Paraflavitalea speifideaquila TaxID=3076558 RepID=UPI0028EC74E1|nr:hypothetical protein [Paraflavitalea speifideiaquila]